MLPNQETDEFTGHLTPEAEKVEAIVNLESVVAQASVLREMQATEGWQMLSRFLKTEVSWMTDLLKVEQDYKKIKRLQAEILALETLPKIIEKSFEDAEEASKKLKELVEGT